MYQVYEEKLVNEEGERYITYGIACDEKGVTVSDVTLNRDKLECFVNLINMEELHPIHLMDVIEDYLGELQ